MNREEAKISLLKLRACPKSFFAILNNNTTKNFINKNTIIREHIANIRSKIAEGKSNSHTIGDNIVS